MRYIDSTSIGGVAAALNRVSELPKGAGQYSLLFGVAGLHKMSKAQRKKIARRRFRMFVDNIIMHHKRLHDKNRQITIDLARSRIAEKEKEKRKRKKELENKEKHKWRDKYAKHNRALEIKERINARRIRAKSGWVAMIEEKRMREVR